MACRKWGQWCGDTWTSTEHPHQIWASNKHMCIERRWGRGHPHQGADPEHHEISARNCI